MSLFAISNYVTKFEIAPPKQIVKNLITKITVPVIILVAASMINGAQAVLYANCSYAECIDNCSKIDQVFNQSLCYLSCNFFHVAN